MTIKDLLAKAGQIRSLWPVVYHGIIISLFTILTAMMTYPVVTNMTGAIMGRGDAWQVLYILWYTKQALLVGDPNLTMTYTNYIFYPHGVQMIFSAFSMFGQLVGVPLQMLFGLAATYNILWLLSFILAGYGTFLLVRYLTGNDGAALVSGIVFAFSPYHFEQAQMHLGATTIEWIPFCALFMMRMFREKSLKNAFFAGLFFILVALSDSQYMLYMAMFAGLLFVFDVYYTLRSKADAQPRLTAFKDLLVRYIVFGATALAGAIPLNYDLLKIASSGDNFLYQSITGPESLSGDLVGFLTPSFLHPIFGGWAADNVYRFFIGNNTEYVTYIGMTVLALSIFAVIVLRKEKEVKFWAVSAALSMLMVLGPILHIMGAPQNLGPVPMPYSLAYYWMPFMQNSRMPDRIDVIVMLSFAVLAGYGIARIMGSIKRPERRTLFLGVAAVLILFEFLTVPTISTVAVPSFYEQLGNDTAHYAVLEIPASTNYEAGLMSEYYQTISDKPMVGGQVPRKPDHATDFENDTPLINDLTFWETSDFVPGDDIFVQNEAAIGGSVLNYYDIRYVILHPEYMAYQQVLYDTQLLNDTLRYGPVYEDDDIIVYQVSQFPPQPFMVVGDGWSSPVKDDGIAWRTMDDASTIDVIAPVAGTYNVSFIASSSYMPLTIDVSVNGEKAYSQFVRQRSPTNVSTSLTLKAGDNVIGLAPETAPDAGVSNDYKELMGDLLQTSFAVANFSVSKADVTP